MAKAGRTEGVFSLPWRSHPTLKSTRSFVGFESRWGDEMTVGEIANRFADTMSEPAISKHLSILENAGLVWREKRGQNVH
jgi:ArsR family transcriptional regulator